MLMMLLRRLYSHFTNVQVLLSSDEISLPTTAYRIFANNAKPNLRNDESLYLINNTRTSVSIMLSQKRGLNSDAGPEILEETDTNILTLMDPTT